MLRAGISVWTTVNVQHIESERDAVARITGVRVRETVPDTILERADDLRLIDLPPDQLLERLRAGKVYVPGHGRPGGRTLLRAGQPDRAPPARAPVRRRGRGPGDGRADAVPGDPGAVAGGGTGPRRGPDRAVRGPDGPGRVPDGEPAPGRVDRARGRDGAGPGGPGGGPGTAPRGTRAARTLGGRVVRYRASDVAGEISGTRDAPT